MSFVSGRVPHFLWLSHSEKKYLPLSRSLLPFTTDHRRWFWVGQWLLGILTLFPSLQRSPLPLQDPCPGQHTGSAPQSSVGSGAALTPFCTALRDGGTLWVRSHWSLQAVTVFPV